jgi:membrane protein YqaA with SNARE-associated domain
VPDPASLAQYGLVGLFLAAFLAGSILPFSSEVVLVAVLAVGVPTWSAVAVATVGNVLGALTLYAMGRLVASRPSGRGLSDRLLTRLTSADPTRLKRARERLEKWGPVILLAAWIPIVGDVLVLAAGLLALPIVPVTVYTSIGKAARYAALAAVFIATR